MYKYVYTYVYKFTYQVYCDCSPMSLWKKQEREVTREKDNYYKSHKVRKDSL